jgi:hypothetical protein
MLTLWLEIKALTDTSSREQTPPLISIGKGDNSGAEFGLTEWQSLVFRKAKKSARVSGVRSHYTVGVNVQLQ